MRVVIEPKVQAYDLGNGMIRWWNSRCDCWSDSPAECIEQRDLDDMPEESRNLILKVKEKKNVV